jgi:hypothetical protein
VRHVALAGDMVGLPTQGAPLPGAITATHILLLFVLSFVDPCQVCTRGTPLSLLTASAAMESLVGFRWGK